MKYVPKEIKEEVNVTAVHPLVNFGYLLGTVTLAGVILYASLGFIAARLATRIGPETEEKIGNTLIAGLISDPESASDDRIIYLTALAESLTPQDPSLPPLKIHILQPETASEDDLANSENAFAIAGGHIVFTQGLLEAVESENELAFVLAHEMGHLHNRDSLKAMGRSLVFLMLVSVLGQGQSGGARVIPATINVANLSYSRSQESAADRYAIALIVQHYDHGGGSLGFFERMQQQELDLGALNTVTEWQSTHPLTRARISRIKQIAAAQNWKMQGELTPLPEGISCVDFVCED
ncbi:M48 family metallopeptidase [Romeria aff. gracilis LEGE 07310]|uniref:M48 family metallopeptidase n=1 Tax=Vasconcelosia minhoensis LEGE 07310 TaxID=915328 RepID=A0A8J7DA78_9CYAN|nr:M48 family metallopeptidase [Romeria gracilis]MBE9076117.1 M48 family metallopeptidase [Romeria aff. gracilis LEGE 07310]